jgi:hypothetical protein
MTAKDDGTAAIEAGEQLVELSYDQGLGGRPRAVDTLYERFDKSPQGWAPAADGLPSPVGIQISGAVPLTYDSLVCLEDRRQFVIRGPHSRTVLATFEPSEVEQTSGAQHRAPFALAASRLAASRSLEALLLARRLVTDAALLGGQVEPVRPRCAHFGRQMHDFPEDDQHQFVERLCMRRASTEGIPLSLMDQAVYGCDLRSPRHIESERRMDGMDEKIIRRAQEKLAELNKPRFDVEAALDDDAANVSVPFAGGGNGIFDSR